MSDNQQVGTAPTQTAGEVVAPVQNGQKQVSDKPERTYTQAEVNKIVADRLARVKKQPVKANGNLQKEVARLQGQLAQYEIQLANSKHNIAEGYEDYVRYKVLHNTNKDKSYEKALGEFLESEEGRKFVKTEERVPKPQPRPKNSNTMESKTANSDLRRAFGLKN